MAKVVKVAQTIRNNWKKSVAGTVAVYYGVNKAKDTYDAHQLMREYCEDAKRYGEAPTPVEAKPRHITVILNPAANRRRAKKEFEDFCAPLLHLAGLSVTVVQTEGEGQARTLVEKLEEGTNAILVAGGDGTLSEVVTGLLRRPDGSAIVRSLPVGVLPVGRTNSVAGQLFADSTVPRARFLAEAAMSVIRETTKPIDVIKIEVLQTDQDSPGRPVFSVVGLEWGAFRDALAKRDKYWYFGPLRGYASYFFTGMKGDNSEVSWKCEAKVEFIPPCEGCSRCYKDREDLRPEQAPRKSWWTVFTPRQSAPLNPSLSPPPVVYSQITNDNCGKQQELDVVTSDFSLLSSNVDRQRSQVRIPHLELSYGPASLSFTDFVSEGWRREQGEKPRRTQFVQAKEIKIWPVKHLPSTSSSSVLQSTEQQPTESSKKQDKEKWISIDHEDYELKPIHVKLLPNMIRMYCSPHMQTSG